MQALTAVLGLLERMLVPLPADFAELIVGTFPQINLISATVFRNPPSPPDSPTATDCCAFVESNSCETNVLYKGNNSFPSAHFKNILLFDGLLKHLDILPANWILVVYLWLLSIFYILQMILHSPKPSIFPPLAI